MRARAHGFRSGRSSRPGIRYTPWPWSGLTAVYLDSGCWWLAGLFQVNVKVPESATAGDAALEIRVGEAVRPGGRCGAGDARGGCGESGGDDRGGEVAGARNAVHRSRGVSLISCYHWNAE